MADMDGSLRPTYRARVKLRRVVQPASRALDQVSAVLAPVVRAASRAVPGRVALVLGFRAPAQARQFVLMTMHRVARRWPLLAGLLGLAGESAEGTAPSTPSNGHTAHGPILRPDPATTATLIAALRDPSAEVAVGAVEALQRHPPELAAAALREVLDNRDGYFNTSTRAAAVRALGVLLPTGKGEAFAAAASDVDAAVSVAAIGALVERHDETSEDLEDQTGFYVTLTRHAAARGLALLRRGDPKRVSTILQRESDTVVREALVSLAAQ
jgi:hypothetical protein